MYTETTASGAQHPGGLHRDGDVNDQRHGRGDPEAERGQTARVPPPAGVGEGAPVETAHRKPHQRQRREQGQGVHRPQCDNRDTVRGVVLQVLREAGKEQDWGDLEPGRT